jgi:hypothetical protein
MARFSTFVTPAASGLPNWKVALAFPILVGVGVIVLVILHISGTSSGVEWYSLGSGHDPRLILGSPRAIRSDEWLVQQSWVVSQAQTGFGVINPTLPGGADMAVLSELPSWDWSTIFRPHLWGYLFLGLDAGIAWFWWLPAAGLVVGCYEFVIAILPRRPITAAMFAIAIYFAPLLQWFYTPSSVWPVAWSLLAMAGVVWILRDPRRWVRVVWSALLGYFAVTMAMGLYVPFIIPCVLLTVAFAVGFLFRERGWRSSGMRTYAGRLVPLGIAAIGAGLAVISYVYTHRAAFDAIDATVYPGTRSVPTGSLLVGDPYFTGMGGAPWSQVLKAGAPSILGPNSSEGSSAFILCIFLVFGMAWYAIRSLRRGAETDWLLVACIVLVLILAAELLVPGWTGLSKLLLLDRVPPERFRIFLVVSIPVFAVLVIEQAQKQRFSRNLGPALISTAVGVIFTIYLVWRIATADHAVLSAAPTWGPVTAALIVATFLLFVRGGAPWAALLLVGATVVMTANVNPLYRGLFDLRTTAIGQKVATTEKAHPGAWIGVGSYPTMAVLVESGVESFTGVQNYPPLQMWKDIDPTSKYASVWNRLAHVEWRFGSGSPKLTNPQADVVQGNFDACSSFAQKHVDYVLSDVQPPSRACMSQLAKVHQGPSVMWIYRVVAPSAP